MNRYLTWLVALVIAATPLSASADETSTGSGSLASLATGLRVLCHRPIIADPAIATMQVSLPTTSGGCSAIFAALEQRYHLHAEQQDGVLVIVADSAASTTQAAQLRYASATTTVDALRSSPLTSQGLTAIADARTNTVVLQGPTAIVNIAMDIVHRQDVGAPPSTGDAVAIQNVDVNDAADQLTRLFADGSYGRLTVVAKPEVSSLLLAGPPGTVALAKQWLATSIDVPVPEVYLQVRVYDVQPQNDNTDVGVLFGGVAPGGSSNGAITVTPSQIFEPFINRSLQVNATINTLIQRGHAQVLASPNILVRSGETMPLHIGQIQPIVSNNGGFIGGNTVSQLDTGITLTATPIASANGRVHLALAVSYSEVVGYNQGYPLLNARSVSSKLDVDAGQTITFGGLTSDTNSVTDTTVPILGSIPVFGRLFHNIQTSREKEEVIFEVTPCVLRPSATPGQPATRDLNCSTTS